MSGKIGKFSLPAMVLFLMAACASPAAREEAWIAREIRKNPVVMVTPLDSDEKTTGGALAMARMAIGYLSSVKKLSVITPEDRASVIREFFPAYEKKKKDVELKIARYLGADLIFTGEFAVEREIVEIELEIIDTLTGSTHNAGTVSQPTTRIGYLPQDLVRAWIGATESEELENFPEKLIGEDESNLFNFRKKPDQKPVEIFGNGLVFEPENRLASVFHYRNALALEPAFVDAVDRILFLENRDRLHHAETRLRMTKVLEDFYKNGRTDMVNVAFVMDEFGRISMENGRPEDGEFYFSLANSILKEYNRQFSLYYVKTLSSLGDIAHKKSNYNDSLSFYKNAQEILERMGKVNSLFYVKNLVRIGTVYAANEQYDLSLRNFLLAKSKLAAMDLKESGLYSTVIYNLGNLQGNLGKTEAALDLFEEARLILSGNALVNSRLYQAILLNMGNSFKNLDEPRQALGYYDRIITNAKMLGNTRDEIVASALYNIVLARREVGSESKTAGGTRGLLSLQNLNYELPRFVGCFLPYEAPGRGDFFQTVLEEHRMRSFTGAFDFEAHRQMAKARTYGGRLEDTNILLKDLLESWEKDRYKKLAEKRETDQLKALRKKFLSWTNNAKGSGVVFIDIGPALANPIFSATTTHSIAQDFADMAVIALDLPEQVTLFKKALPAYLQNKLLALKNVNILSGNGHHSLRDQMDKRENWAYPERGAVRVETGTPLIIRSANSMDIYSEWGHVEPALRRMGRDFKENPVLLFFNRSIAYKPVGSIRFRVIGFLSPRGFHHMTDSLDREGEEPYTLSPSVTLDDGY